MADGALVLDMAGCLRMIDRFAANAGLPVRVARGVGHHAGPPVDPDRNILSRWSRELVMTGNASVGRLKTRLHVTLWRTHRHRYDQDQNPRTNCHYQPS